MTNKIKLSSPEVSKALSSIRFSLPLQKKQELFDVLRETYKKSGQKATVSDLPSSWVNAVEKYLVSAKKTFKADLTKRKKKEDLHNHAVIEAARKKHAAAIAAAIGAGIHGWQKAVEQAVASAPTQGADYSALKVIANQAVQHNVTVSSDALQGTFRAVLGDAGEAGFTNAASALKVGPIKTGASFQALLDNIDASASGVQGTTMTRIVDTITQGLTSGLSARDIGTAINGIINDPTRADMIAVTETNTAYNAASIDTYAAAGLAGWEWIAYDGACEICLSLEGFHDITDTDFPSDASHPNCRCTVNGSEQTSGD